MPGHRRRTDDELVGEGAPALFMGNEAGIARHERLPPRANVLGVGVSATDLPGAVAVIEGWIARRQHRYVCVTGVHGVMECQRDETLRRTHNAAGLVTPDGMPLVWLSRLQGFQEVDRVYGPDLMPAVCERGVPLGWRHYLFGGNEGVADLLAERLAARHPGIRFVGTWSPPFSPLSSREDEQIVRRINESNADVVWVGLSTPKQERWMAEHVGRLSAYTLIGVGAAFDFLAGLKLQAPRWIQRSGFEWLFRLATEPRRLWKRYAVNNPLFMMLVLGQAMGLRRYDLGER